MPSDPVARGMVRQLARLDGPPRGWKVAFSTPGAQAAAGVDRPLVGWLADATEVGDGATIDVRDWVKPTVEVELAIHVGAGVPAGGTRDDAARAIVAVSAAIEVVDIDRPLNAVEDVVAEGLFHRFYVLGAPDPARAGGDARGVTLAGALDGATYATHADPCAVIGDLPDIVRHVADELGRHGAALRAGEVVLGGSALGLEPVRIGQALRVDAGPLGTLGVRFA